MRFARKSPAVGSMKRHWPEDDLIVAPVKARVAVSSRGFACAASEGFSTPPARETATTEGLAGVAVVAGGAGAADVITGPTEADNAEATEVATTVTVAKVEPPEAASVVEDSGLGAGASTIGAGELIAEALVTGAGAAGALSPKLKDWLGSAELQAAMSMMAPLTVKQLPGAFSGVRARGPAPPEKGNS